MNTRWSRYESDDLKNPWTIHPKLSGFLNHTALVAVRFHARACTHTHTHNAFLPRAAHVAPCVLIYRWISLQSIAETKRLPDKGMWIWLVIFHRLNNHKDKHAYWPKASHTATASDRERYVYECIPCPRSVPLNIFPALYSTFVATNCISNRSASVTPMLRYEPRFVIIWNRIEIKSITEILMRRLNEADQGEGRKHRKEETRVSRHMYVEI